mmetsp:Transcript_31672/g.61244  ORF Transcript_31672/g.61244 Transcript_31672/m.61244 type:complete len:242 (-) Transcript_31672:428-1153(-)
MPVTVKRHSATNVSLLRVCATTSNNRLRNRRDTSTKMPSPPIALRNAAPIIFNEYRSIGTLPVFSKRGSATSKGTTAMSCIRRTPSVAAPYFVDNSPLSPSNCSTNAEDERDNDNPITTASSTEKMLRKFSWCPVKSAITAVPMACPTGRRMAVNAPALRRICGIPMPNAYFARAFSLSTVSSKPISKRRNWTPNSDRVLISRFSWNNPNRLSKNPARRYPNTGDCFNFLNRGTIATVVPR